MLASRILLLTSLLLVVMSLVRPPRSWASCWEIYEQARVTDNLERLRTLYATAQHTPDCDGHFRMELGRRVAVTYTNLGRAVLRAGGDTARRRQVETMLRDSLPYARLWQALAMLGDLAHDRKAYTEATRYYQEAFELSQDAQNTPIPPAMQVTQVLFKKAETSRLLADEYVPMARTQPHLVQTAGYTGGTRSFVPQRQAIPITFVFDSTQFDRKGQQAAQDLLRLLQDRQPPAITLIGHTDPQGSDAYNLRLSEQRAEAVKAFLAQGYHGRIRTEGHGERELYQPDDPQKYTEDELYRLYRRVELRFE